MTTMHVMLAVDALVYGALLLLIWSWCVAAGRADEQVERWYREHGRSM